MNKLWLNCFKIKNNKIKNNKTKNQNNNYCNQHPFEQGEKIIQQIDHPLYYAANIQKIEPQNFTAFHINQLEKPKWLEINEEEINKNIEHTDNINIFYTDGSVNRILNKGGAAFVLTNSPHKKYNLPYNQKISFNIPLENNFYELAIINTVILFLIKNNDIITGETEIYTDSANTLGWLNQSKKTNSSLIHNLIYIIYNNMWVLKNIYNIQKIKIYKIKAHSISHNNNLADIYAKEAAEDNNLNPNNYNSIPYNTSIQILKSHLSELANQRWLTYTSSTNHPNILTKFFSSKTRKIKQYLGNLQNHFDRYIICNLILNQIKTNHYYSIYNFNNEVPNNGNCEYCTIKLHVNYPETMDHIIYECPKYHTERMEFRLNLEKISSLYKDNMIYTQLENIIFPYKFIQYDKPEKDNTIPNWMTVVKYLKSINHPAIDKLNPMKAKINIIKPINQDDINNPNDLNIEDTPEPTIIIYNSIQDNQNI